MRDLIFRQAALKEAKEIAAYHWDFKVVTHKFVDSLEKLAPADLWIPCKKRLPNDDEPFEVYCCDKYGEQLIAHPFKDENSDTGFSAESEGCFMYNCIAWMPPFEPYKEKEHEST